MENIKDKTKIKITDLLKSHTQGLTIKEIMDKTGLARHTVLARLHHLIGEGKIYVRQINMAKLHYWKEHPPNQEELTKALRDEKVRIVPITKEHIKKPSFEKSVKKESKGKKEEIDVSSIKEEIERKFKKGEIQKKQAEILKQREPVNRKIGSFMLKEKKSDKKTGRIFIQTGVPGFDDLLEQGIPKGSTIVIAGGAGSGKTIFCLQTLVNHANQGKKCLYISFEESEKNLKKHIEDFGWNLKKGENLKIERFNPFDITRNVDALLAQQKGELLIDIYPMIIPENFKPDFIVIDSLTAIASAFIVKEESYRIYIEQLFRFFEKIGATSLLITETEQIPKIFSRTGVEEFLADGVIVFYNLKHGNVRENAIEVLKLRGGAHKKKIVAMQITDKGIVVYPEQEVFSEVKE